MAALRAAIAIFKVNLTNAQNGNNRLAIIAILRHLRLAKQAASGNTEPTFFYGFVLSKTLIAIEEWRRFAPPLLYCKTKNKGSPLGCLCFL